MKIGGYIRVSTKAQITEEGSIVNQEQKIKKYHNYKYPKTKLKEVSKNSLKHLINLSLVHSKSHFSQYRF